MFVLVSLDKILMFFVSASSYKFLSLYSRLASSSSAPFGLPLVNAKAIGSKFRLGNGEVSPTINIFLMSTLEDSC